MSNGTKRRAPVEQSAGPIEALTTTQVYARYKATAPYQDLIFFARHLDAERYAELLDAAERLERRAFDGERLILPRAAFYQQLTALQDRWRSWDRRPSDEAAFWAAHHYDGRRQRGQAYRGLREKALRHTREAADPAVRGWHTPTPSWSVSGTIEGMHTEVAEEVAALAHEAFTLQPALREGKTES